MTTTAKRAPSGKGARFIWHFGHGKADGHAGLRDELGGKGANLAEMSRIGLPVPPGFTIGARVCERYRKAGGKLPVEVRKGVDAAIRRLEKQQGKGFGDPKRPLLVSVRSGAAVSMPGMMDTVLNLGLTAAATEGMAELTGNRRFALDARRRFIQMFANVVEGFEVQRFEQILERELGAAGAISDSELDAASLERVVSKYLALYRRLAKRPFPEDPREQLERSISAVFGSWMGKRAVEYREINGITGLLGTAVNVQAMVFGNLGPGSGTGVCFTRDPSTGENVFYGEYLLNAQGEDVVAGIRTPEDLDGLPNDMPEVYDQLLGVRKLLESHYRDMQDIEFTVEDGTLYILQTRAGQRTARAAVRIAVEMAKSRLITQKEAVSRISPHELDRLLHPQFDPKAERDVLTRGLPASPGAVSGRVVFTADEAKEWKAAGERVILVRNETSPEDVGGMHASEGILTATGGMTSHAAVVARGMGKCCVAGAGEVRIDELSGHLRIFDTMIARGDVISLDGTSGEVMDGAVKTMPADPGTEFRTLLAWADKLRRLRVRANADNPGDARIARDFGAVGIGLCRTEHMFFGESRITPMREMILANDEKSRRKALRKLLPFQRRDFTGILKAMDGLPVTIRLLDPPLHEFLPQDEESITHVAEALGVATQEVRERARRLHEMNPMLGHRGCRLGITYPEIYEMQVRAIFEAACGLKAKDLKPKPEVMIPLIGTVAELRVLKERLVGRGPGGREEEGRPGARRLRDHDRDPPRGAARRGHRSGGRVLLLRHERPDADDLRLQPRRHRQLPAGVPRRGHPADRPVPVARHRRASASSCGIGTERGRKASPQASRSASAASTGATPTRSPSATTWGSTTSPARPFRVPIARLAAAQARVVRVGAASEATSRSPSRIARSGRRSSPPGPARCVG